MSRSSSWRMVASVDLACKASLISRRTAGGFITACVGSIGAAHDGEWSARPMAVARRPTNGDAAEDERVATPPETCVAVALVRATECERALEADINLGHRPIRQHADALFEDTPVDGGDLRDVDDRVRSQTHKI
jgi:hypothetical protein